MEYKDKVGLYNHVKELMMESLYELSGGMGFDEGRKKKREKKHKKEKDSKGEESKKSISKRNEVMDWLNASQAGDTESYSINHADIMRKLWHPKDEDEEDALRSLFSKKMHHKLNDNGSEYDFTDTEINTLYNIKSNLV